MSEALFWDTFIQNNFVRASPAEIDDMEPGIIFGLMGLWQGRGKYTQEMAPKSDKPKEPRKRNDSRNG